MSFQVKKRMSQPSTKRRCRTGRLVHRHGYGGIKGWFFRAARHSGKLFSDSKYGGSWRASARAALEHRNKLVPVAERMKNIRFYHKEPSKGSVTGIAGVFMSYKKATYGRYSYVVGTYYSEPFKIKRKQFSVRRLGMDEAIRRAEEFRKKGIAEIDRKNLKRSKL